MSDLIKSHSQEIVDLQAKIIELERKNKQLSKQIRVNESLHLSVLNALPINIFLEDPEGHTIFANNQACQANGINLEDIRGKTVYDFFPQSIAEINRANDLEVWDHRKLITKEVPAGFKGKEHHMFSGKTILHINESKEDVLLGFALDITDRVKTEALLRDSEAKFRSVIEHALDSFFLIEKNGLITEINTTAYEILGYSMEELLGMKTEMVFSRLPEKIKLLNADSLKNSSANFEDMMTGKNNTKIPVDINIRKINIGEKQMFFAFCRDIRDKKRAEAQIKHMAYHDALTDLPNRWYIHSYLEKYLSIKENENSKLGVILLDLDHFKVINDSLGHDAGDLLLKEVSKRLQTTSKYRKTTLARFGGDEFIFLVPHISSEKDLTIICEKIIQVLVAPFYLFGQKYNISASVGISLYPKDGKDLNTLIKNADLAMYGSKDQGRSCFSFYQPIMKQQAIERMDLEISLRAALEENEFILHYQPKINMRTGQINGVEALIRWRDKQNNILLPDSFLHIAEETGLFIQIGEWVIREACRQCKNWHDLGYEQLTVSVNISPYQFQKNNLEDLVISVLGETGLPPWALELELTEGTVMKQPDEAALLLRNLKNLGIKLSIDDFGTGYSSLSYLKLFPIDTLKIDKSFIGNLQFDEANTNIVTAIISLAHNLNLQVVAEGVEAREQYDFLLQGSCDFGQGYYFSEPLNPIDFFDFLIEYPYVNIKKLKVEQS